MPKWQYQIFLWQTADESNQRRRSEPDLPNQMVDSRARCEAHRDPNQRQQSNAYLVHTAMSTALRRIRAMLEVAAHEPAISLGQGVVVGE